MTAIVADTDTLLEKRWERTMSLRPVCPECGRHILTDRYVKIGRDYYCWDCIECGMGFTEEDFGEDEPW